MLSILIPTYNYICVGLVEDLHLQAEALGLPYEILVADDASDETFKERNRDIALFSHCSYIELPRNLGRARIRNLLGKRAKYPYLLFIDSDAAVVKPDFLARYWAAHDHAKVIYGGLVHADKLPSPDVVLAYTYEKSAEPKHVASLRSQRPYASFRTFNFMVRRDVFLQHPFDESITCYGHEDTLFGKSLQTRGVEILHIDNPLMNRGLDNNMRLLYKTEESLRTLFTHRKKLEGCSAILHAYALLRKYGLVLPFRACYKLFRPLLRCNLLGRHPSLIFFRFYKLGYYTDLAARGGKK